MPRRGSSCPQSDTVLSIRETTRFDFECVRGVLTVTDTHSADELGYGSCVEHISDHSVRLALIETALVSAGDDAARILAAVLEK